MSAGDLKRFVARHAMDNFESLSPEERAALLEGLALILEGQEAMAAGAAAAAIHAAEASQLTFQNLLKEGKKEGDGE